jgi:hypothetical protein
MRPQDQKTNDSMNLQDDKSDPGVSSSNSNVLVNRKKSIANFFGGMPQWLSHKLWPLPARISNSVWNIKLIPNGFSLMGFKLPLNDWLPQQLQDKIRYLVALSFITGANGTPDTTYAYVSTGINATTTYKLVVNFGQNLLDVLSELQQGRCNVTAAPDLSYVYNLINQYCEYTDPKYGTHIVGAELWRDRQGVANPDIENCISQLLEMACQAYEDKTGSIVLFVALGIIVSLLSLSAGIAAIQSLKQRCNRAKDLDEEDASEGVRLSLIK